jgi:RHS repeat-associated protein
MYVSEIVRGHGQANEVRRPCRRPSSRFRNSCRSRFHSHPLQSQSLPGKARTCLEGPFGEVLRATGPMAKANPFRFSTKYQDDETDLVYYGYRSEKDGCWLSRDPVGEQGFRVLTARAKKTAIPQGNLYGFVSNAPLDNYDYLGLSGTGSGGAGCAISPSNMGRVSFRGFSLGKVAEFRLIDEDDPDKVSIPDASGASSGRVDGFWWKGLKTHWYKLPDFCWAIVEPDSSEEGFSVHWCCEDCIRLVCELSRILKNRPCTPGFVPNSGSTHIGKYPFEDE